MKKKSYKTVIQTIMIAVFASILGLLLLSISFMLPTEDMKSNAETALLSFDKEGDYTIIPGEKGTRLSNFTDAEYIRLALVGNDEEGAIVNALGGYTYVSKISESDDAITRLREYFDIELSDSFVKEAQHIRFWNGYLILLKPLLMVMNYSNIRQLNIILELSLIICITLLLYRRNLATFIIPFLLAYFGMNPIALTFNMFHAGLFYCIFIPIVFLLMRGKLSQHETAVFFEIVGITVAYFNMNSFQLVSWGFSFVIYSILNREYFRKPVYYIKSSLLCLAAWLFGFGSMMISKWILAYFFTDIDVVSIVWDSVATRFSDVQPGAKWVMDNRPRTTAVVANFQAIKSGQMWLFIEVTFIIFMLLYLSFKIYKIVKRFMTRNNVNTDQKKQEIMPNLISLLFMCVLSILVPCVRYLLLANHSTIHAHTVYRDLCISVFAINTFLIRCMELLQGEYGLCHKQEGEGVSGNA